MKYARMITATVPIDKIAEVSRLYEQTAVPALKPITGFLGTYMFSDPITGEGFSLTFWETEKDAIAFEKTPLYAELLGKFRPFFTNQPVVKTYQVTVETPLMTTVVR
jgi:heme-degrading monooxygenase HmoA